MKSPRISPLILVTAILLASTPSRAADPTVDVTVRANVKASLNASAIQPLEFGNVYRGSAAKTIAANDALYSGSLRINGANGASVQVQAPNSITLTDGNGGSLTVDQFKVKDTYHANNPFFSDFNDGAFPRMGTIDGTGQAQLSIGGTLQAIDNTQATGQYTGTLTVTLVAQ